MDALQYFAEYENYFWQREEEGKVIAIPGGATLCYRETLQEVLDVFSGRPLPPFGSLLMAIAATSSYVSDGLGEVRGIIVAEVKRKTGSSQAGGARLSPLDGGLAFCKTLAALPEQYKHGSLRLLVLQTVFENPHNAVATRKAKAIIEQAGDYPVQGAIPKHDAFADGVYQKDFRTLELLGIRFPTPESILKRMAELPSVPDPVLLFSEADPAESGAPKDFLEALLATPQTFPVAALVRHLWSGLQIPAHHALPSDQPFGGASDLSNRGPLERLLLSEHAYDDLVFLSRMASGEALYTARERPPASETVQRVILIDNTLKAWGTPRTLAYAVLLAIARHPKTDIPCAAYSLGGDFRPISFGSVDEVIASLSLLDHSLHPAEGLDRLFRSKALPARAEVILLAPAETLESRAVQAALAEWGSGIEYTVSTSSDGRLSVYKKQGRGKRLLQELTLPLGELWKRPEPPQATGVVLYTSIAEYPLLFFDPPAIEREFATEDGGYCLITKNASVLRQASREKGWALVVERLPAGGTDWAVGASGDGEMILLHFARQTRDLTLINLVSGDQQTVRFTAWKPSLVSFYFHAGVFYHFQGPNMWLIRWDAGEVRVEGALPTDNEVLQAHQKERAVAQEATPRRRPKGSVLKNITEVGVSGEGFLTINQYRLDMQNGFLRLSLPHPANHISERAPMVQAQAAGDGEFVFPDGSNVRIHPAGILILRSSKKREAPIFVPSVLNRSLAAATQMLASGPDYFLPDDTKLQVVSMQQFFANYINAFTSHILQHGTNAAA